MVANKMSSDLKTLTKKLCELKVYYSTHFPHTVLLSLEILSWSQSGIRPIYCTTVLISDQGIRVPSYCIIEFDLGVWYMKNGEEKKNKAFDWKHLDPMPLTYEYILGWIKQINNHSSFPHHRGNSLSPAKADLE